MGERWRNLDDEERQRFEALAAADRVRAAAELAAYKPPPPGQLAAAAAERTAAARKARQPRPMRLAPPLAELLGVTGEAPVLTRGEVISRMHAYFKQQELLDPEDRRFVLANGPLRQLFGQERFKAFAVGALLAPMLSRVVGGAGGEEGSDSDSDDDDEEARQAEEAACNAAAALPGERGAEAD